MTDKIPTINFIDHNRDCWFNQPIEDVPSRDWLRHENSQEPGQKEITTEASAFVVSTHDTESELRSKPEYKSTPANIFLGAAIVLPILFIISALTGDIQGNVGNDRDRYDGARMDR